jgi:hypothetical protein
VCVLRNKINLPCLCVLFHDEILLHFMYPNQNIISAHRIDAETEGYLLGRDLLHKGRSCNVLTLYSSLL